MKKNITINLCGRLYQIDEDAYEILQQYINSLRSVFGKSEGGDEIVDDIEARIAELFDELKQSGTEAITIDHVKDIIVRIGEPEQLAGDDESSEPKAAANEPSNAKPNDKIIAGVMSRLAAKYGGKVTHWRIGFILLLFFINFILFPFFKIQHYPSSMFFVLLLNALLVATYFILAILLPNKTDKQSTAQTSQNDATSSKPKTKQLYRNPNDKMLAGVLSGFAARFGGDVSLWRVGFIVLALFTTLLAVVAYVILAIVVPESETATGEPNSRKFFRNPNDKMVAGVLSGLAARFGGDASLWRICFILLTVGAFVFAAPFMSFPYFGNAFLHFSGVHRELTICFANFFFIILYIVLAIIVPEAKTPEQLLQMRGMPVTPQNLATVVTEGEQPKPRRGFLGRFFSVLFKIVAGIAAIIAFVICTIMCIAILAAIIATITVLIFPDLLSNFTMNIEQMAFTGVWGEHTALVIVFVLALSILLTVTIFAIIRLIVKLTGKSQPMGIGKRIVLTAIWVLALCCLVPTGIAITNYTENNIDYLREQISKNPNHSSIMMYKNGSWVTADGWHIYADVPMRNFDVDYLNNNDLTLSKQENCNGSFAWRGESWEGSESHFKPYFEVRNGDCSPVCQVERKLPIGGPGVGHISCIARAQGHGVYLFAALASAPDHPIAMAEIPPYGDKGGELWEQATDSTFFGGINGVHIRNANHGQGFGWSKVVLEYEVKHADMLIYGITSDSTFTGKPCNSMWFSADELNCSFGSRKPGTLN